MRFYFRPVNFAYVHVIFPPPREYRTLYITYAPCLDVGPPCQQLGAQQLHHLIQAGDRPQPSHLKGIKNF